MVHFSLLRVMPTEFASQLLENLPELSKHYATHTPRSMYPAWVAPLLLLSFSLALIALALSIRANLVTKQARRAADDEEEGRREAAAGGASSRLLASARRQRSADLESSDETFYSLSSEGEEEEAKRAPPECIAAMIEAFEKNGCRLTADPPSAGCFPVDAPGATLDQVYEELLRLDDKGVMQRKFVSEGASKIVRPGWQPFEGGLLRWTTYHLPLRNLPFSPTHVHVHAACHLSYKKEERRIVVSEMIRPLEVIYCSSIENQFQKVFREVPGGPGEPSKVEMELFEGIFWHGSCIVWPIAQATARSEAVATAKITAEHLGEALRCRLRSDKH